MWYIIAFCISFAVLTVSAKKCYPLLRNERVYWAAYPSFMCAWIAFLASVTIPLTYLVMRYEWY